MNTSRAYKYQIAGYFASIHYKIYLISINNNTTMKQKTLFLILLSFIILINPSVNNLNAIDFASKSWSDFKKQTELFVWVKLVKWSNLRGSKPTYTFSVRKIYKGPKLKTVTLTIHNRRLESLGHVGLYAEGFLALKRKNGAWVQTANARSWWEQTIELTDKYQSLTRVALPVSLITNIPESLKKKRVRLVAILANLSHHQYDADIYLLKDVDIFLTQEFKRN